MGSLAAVLGHPLPWALMVVGYLAGSIPFGLVLAKALAGTDVRTAGSGNIGATNVARVVGRRLGAVVLLLDALKGFAPVFMASRLPLPPALAAERLLVEGLVALAAVLGHCHPVWLRLRGGKGVATGLGVVLAHRPGLAAMGLVVFGLTVLVVRRVSAGSLAAVCALLIALFAVGPRDVTLMPLVLCLALIVVRHRDNIRRLRRGTELGA